MAHHVSRAKSTACCMTCLATVGGACCSRLQALRRTLPHVLTWNGKGFSVHPVPQLSFFHSLMVVLGFIQHGCCALRLPIVIFDHPAELLCWLNKPFAP